MKNDYNSYVKSFLDYLLYELNYSSKTINTYEEALKVYEAFLKKNNFDFKKVDTKIANLYKAYLIDAQYENKTSSLKLSAMRSFYSYLREIKVIESNPFLNIHNPKVEKKLPNFLKNNETKMILDFKNVKNEIEARNYVMVEFLYATGLRVSEMVNIKLSDINFSDKTIKIMGKGSKERIVFYKACESILAKYLKDIRPIILKDKPSEYLFINNQGNKISTRMVEIIIQKIAQTQKLKQKVTPHTLRHTFATDLLNNGADIRSVGELLGHESLSTTQIYTHVTTDYLKEVYNNTHPRAKN